MKNACGNTAFLGAGAVRSPRAPARQPWYPPLSTAQAHSPATSCTACSGCLQALRSHCGAQSCARYTDVLSLHVFCPFGTWSSYRSARGDPPCQVLPVRLWGTHRGLMAHCIPWMCSLEAFPQLRSAAVHIPMEIADICRLKETQSRMDVLGGFCCSPLQLSAAASLL